MTNNMLLLINILDCYPLICISLIAGVSDPEKFLMGNNDNYGNNNLYEDTQRPGWEALRSNKMSRIYLKKVFKNTIVLVQPQGVKDISKLMTTLPTDFHSVM